MSKSKCDFCGKPVRAIESQDPELRGRWKHENNLYGCYTKEYPGTEATVNRSVFAPKEPAAPEPVDVETVLGKMRQAWIDAPGVSGYDAMLAALRVAAEALGQTERLWPKKKTPEERVQVKDAVSYPGAWVVTLDDWNVSGSISHFTSKKDAETFRRGVIAEMEEKEGRSK